MNTQVNARPAIGPASFRETRVDARERTVSRAPASPDMLLRDRVLARLALQPWWDVATSNVLVVDGVVTLQGLIQAGEDRRAARTAVARIHGVRAVEDLRRLPRDW